MKTNVGIDIESVERFQNMISKEKLKLLKNIFFEKEYLYATNKVNTAQSLTGIWCAKEAVVKSFSSIKLFSIRDVEIICKKGTAPQANVNFSFEKGFKYSIAISISHTKDYATAISILTIY